MAYEISLAAVRSLLEVQGKDGNWNHSEYMLGLYNGLELAVATMEQRDPVYRSLTNHNSVRGISVAHSYFDHSDGVVRLGNCPHCNKLVYEVDPSNTIQYDQCPFCDKPLDWGK